jgi:hypothetical protein
MAASRNHQNAMIGIGGFSTGLLSTLIASLAIPKRETIGLSESQELLMYLSICALGCLVGGGLGYCASRFFRSCPRNDNQQRLLAGNAAGSDAQSQYTISMTSST